MKDPFFLSLIGINVFLMLLYFFQRMWRSRSESRKLSYQRSFFQRYLNQSENSEALWKEFLRNKRTLVEAFLTLEDCFSLGEESRKLFVHWILQAGLTRKSQKKLHSRWMEARKSSATFFAKLKAPVFIPILIRQLKKEKKETVQLLLCWALLETNQPVVLPEIIDTLLGSSEVYRKRLMALLSSYPESIQEILPLIWERQEQDIIRLIIYFSEVQPTDKAAEYLVEVLGHEDQEIRREAFQALANNYPGQIEFRQFVYNEDQLIRNLAIESFSRFPDKDTIDILIYFLKDDSVYRSTVLSLGNILSHAPKFFPRIQNRFFEETDPVLKERLGEVLSNRMELYLRKIKSVPPLEAALFFQSVLAKGRTSDFTVFMNSNHDLEVEDAILEALKVTDMEQSIHENFCMYLEPRILEKLGWAPLQIPVKRTKQKKDDIRRIWAFFYLGLSFFIPLSTFSVWGMATGRWSPWTSFFNWPHFLQDFLVYLTIFFGVYALAINLIYVVILVVSIHVSTVQNRSYKRKPLSLMFTKGVLPSVSILAPAFNEEATIIESVNSLLNLRYPDYELIVINDGSRDQTLKKVIEYFGLTKRDVFIHQYLMTEPIRGIYTSPRYPELIVVDKMNGGKADSLNAGLNIAKKEFFAGIDSDSLLERDALLKITSLALDSEKPLIAAGGNLLPVNGSDVTNGHITRIGVPRQWLPLWQTVEYIRAFMTGRLGWAGLDSLLIISGAFGLFDRKAVIDMRGYLTNNEKYEKDTVGEDMELVVRLIRNAVDKKIPYKVNYAFNANCWTEAPTTLKVLKSQRDRWQRGLIDVLTFHKSFFLNPKYGPPGILAFPYFLFFEILGPWFELQGLITMVAAIVTGLVNPEWISFAGGNFFLGGLAVTTASLWMAERDKLLFSPKESIRLYIAAVTESLFYRMANMVFRLLATWTIMRGKGGWGKMTRTGFTGGVNPPTKK